MSQNSEFTTRIVYMTAEERKANTIHCDDFALYMLGDKVTLVYHYGEKEVIKHNLISFQIVSRPVR